MLWKQLHYRHSSIGRNAQKQELAPRRIMLNAVQLQKYLLSIKPLIASLADF